MMAKWEVDSFSTGEHYLVCSGDPQITIKEVEEIARKLNAFEGMLEALKAILTNPASAIAHSDLERALVVIAKAEGE